MEFEQSSFYNDCTYYIGGYDLGAGVNGLPLRYRTILVGGKFCFPDPEQGAEVTAYIADIVKKFED